MAQTIHSTPEHKYLSIVLIKCGFFFYRRILLDYAKVNRKVLFSHHKLNSYLLLQFYVICRNILPSCLYYISYCYSPCSFRLSSWLILEPCLWGQQFWRPTKYRLPTQTSTCVLLTSCITFTSRLFVLFSRADNQLQVIKLCINRLAKDQVIVSKKCLKCTKSLNPLLKNQTICLLPFQSDSQDVFREFWSNLQIRDDKVQSCGFYFPFKIQASHNLPF